MSPTEKHPHLEWEVSIVELRTDEERFYKVTRHLPSLHVSETKIFSTLEEAKQQFEEWLK